MAIINDVGEAKDIHPKNKKDPGERLALWALANDYGQNIVCSGPLYRASEIADNSIRVTFDHTGTGLKSRDSGPLKRFEIAGADKAWHWANAKIDGPDAVVVSSPDVPEPKAVRYAWASNPEGANLINSEGLPASVFRTDDWQDVETQAQTNPADARRALATEIKALAAKRKDLDRKSPEYKVLNEKFQALMKQFKAGAPSN
jgi:sialate O-acetylesterase